MDSRGQTLVEFCVSAAMLALVLLAAAGLLRTEWDRGRCAHLVFESTHARLTQKAGPASQIPVTLRDTPRGVHGEARCGQARESVDLSRLDEESP